MNFDIQKLIESGELEVTTKDGEPAIRIQNYIIKLKTIIQEGNEGDISTEGIPTHVEIENDRYAWWEITTEDPSIPDITLEPHIERND